MTVSDNSPQIADGHTVGIDLGTSNSSIARLNDRGDPLVLKNSNGEPFTASVVLLGDGQHAFVGPAMESLLAVDPGRIVVGIKREMGNSRYAVQHGERQLTPEVLSALILMKLKRDAEQQIGPIANAVITVPYYFNDPRRRATRNAGHIAGLNVVDIINEPTAATLAYAWTRGELGLRRAEISEKTILVYDLGGGTFDVTLVNYTPTEFTVIATDGDTRLGGLDWTQRLADYVSEQFRQQAGADPREDPRARLALAERCEEAKRTLSAGPSTVIGFSHEGRTVAVEVTRQQFERMTADLLQRTRDTTEFVLQYAGITAADVDDILLVGGSTRMPAVSQMLMDLWERPPSLALDPQLAVAQGAAIHAAISEAKLTGGSGRLAEAVITRLHSITATDVNSHSLGVEITDPDETGAKRNHIMIPRNSCMPSSVTGRFVTTSENPRSIRVRLLEGDAADVKACTFIGDCRIVDLPRSLPVGSPVEVNYGYDADGHIHVSARELVGNSQASVEIAWDGGVDYAAMEAFRTLLRTYRVE